MKKSSRIIALLVVMLWFITLSVSSQSTTTTTKPTIERQGNVFIQKSSRGSNGQAIKTNYIYQDTKGNQDTIYISSTGKCFVFKVAKKTGYIYRKYLPEITEQLQKEGKIDEKR